MKSKLVRAIILIAIIASSMGIGAVASDTIQKIEAFMRSDFNIVIDGVGSNIGPVFIYEDRSYLPVNQIGLALGADIVWEGATKTIFINSRFHGQPEPTDERNAEYDNISMTSPLIYIVTFRGVEGPVLTLYHYSASGSAYYYRDKDLQSLGMDTRALRKAKDTVTGDIYVSEKELANVWQQKPQMTYATSIVIFGEKDADKRKAITDFISNIPAIEQTLSELTNDQVYRGEPVVIAAESVGDNQAEVLFWQYDSLGQMQFGKYIVEFRKSNLGHWYSNGHRKVFLN